MVKIILHFTKRTSLLLVEWYNAHFSQVQYSGHSKNIIIQTSFPDLVISMAMGKFEVYPDKAGAYRFRLKAPNGEIIATSESYSSKAACMSGIESVKKNAASASVVEVKE